MLTNGFLYIIKQSNSVENQYGESTEGPLRYEGPIRCRIQQAELTDVRYEEGEQRMIRFKVMCEYRHLTNPPQRVRLVKKNGIVLGEFNVTSAIPSESVNRWSLDVYGHKG